MFLLRRTLQANRSNIRQFSVWNKWVSKTSQNPNTKHWLRRKYFESRWDVAPINLGKDRLEYNIYYGLMGLTAVGFFVWGSYTRTDGRYGHKSRN